MLLYLRTANKFLIFPYLYIMKKALLLHFLWPILSSFTKLEIKATENAKKQAPLKCLWAFHILFKYWLKCHFLNEAYPEPLYLRFQLSQYPYAKIPSPGSTFYNLKTMSSAYLLYLWFFSLCSSPTMTTWM